MLQYIIYPHSEVFFIDYNYPTLISLLPNITHKYAIKSGTTDTDLLIMGYNKNAVLGGQVMTITKK